MNEPMGKCSWPACKAEEEECLSCGELEKHATPLRALVKKLVRDFNNRRVPNARD
jgi:hypothetical protein